MSQRKHPKYEYLTSRWGGMKLREEFEERIDNWLKAFDESEHKMLLSLLSQFYYYSEEKVKENSKKLYQKFLCENPEYEKTTIYAFYHLSELRIMHLTMQGKIAHITYVKIFDDVDEFSIANKILYYCVSQITQ